MGGYTSHKIFPFTLLQCGASVRETTGECVSYLGCEESVFQGRGKSGVGSVWGPRSIHLEGGMGLIRYK